jgi:hypothetical protein
MRRTTEIAIRLRITVVYLKRFRSAIKLCLQKSEIDIGYSQYHLR